MKHTLTPLLVLFSWFCFGQNCQLSIDQNSLINNWVIKKTEFVHLGFDAEGYNYYAALYSIGPHKYVCISSTSKYFCLASNTSRILCKLGEESCSMPYLENTACGKKEWAFDLSHSEVKSASGQTLPKDILTFLNSKNLAGLVLFTQDGMIDVSLSAEGKMLFRRYLKCINSE